MPRGLGVRVPPSAPTSVPTTNTYHILPRKTFEEKPSVYRVFLEHFTYIHSNKGLSNGIKSGNTYGNSLNLESLKGTFHEVERYQPNAAKPLEGRKFGDRLMDATCISQCHRGVTNVGSSYTPRVSKTPYHSESTPKFLLKKPVRKQWRKQTASQRYRT